MNARWRGYTLVELLIAVTLFSVLLGSIFSVFTTMRQAERFRDDNVRLTQAASFSFEPIIRAIQAGNAVEAIKPEQEQRDAYGPLSSDCIEVRGFYAESPSANQKLIKTEGLANIATIREERVFDPELGSVSKWVKYVYSWNRLDNTIEETVWEVASQADNWPKPLNSCDGLTWVNMPDRRRVLTPGDVEVKDFKVRIVAPVLAHDDAGVPQHFLRSPFVTVTLTVGYPASRKNVAVPVTFRSTVTPTFSYGEQRDVQ